MDKLKILWLWMRGKRWLYMAAIGAVALETIFAYLAPLLIKFTLDFLIGEKSLENSFWERVVMYGGGIETLRRSLWIISLLLFATALLQGIFSYLRGKYSSLATESITARLRNRVYQHIQSLPCSYFHRAETGDLIQRCTSDVETIRRFLAVQLVEIGRTILMLSCMLPIMWYLDPDMTLVATASIPFLIGFAWIFFVKIRRAFQEADEAEAKMTTVLQENLNGIRVVRAFSRQEYEEKKFNEKNKVHQQCCRRLVRLMSYYWSISDLVCFSQIALLLVIGTKWTIAGHISLGTLVAFISYEGMLLWPIRYFGRILADLGKALIAIGRISEILEEPAEEEQTNNAQKSPLRGEIEFDRVSFSYDQKNWVLEDISFSIKAGQTVALVGPTGAGKTTLVHLIARLYDYSQGSIKVDKNELLGLDRKSVRRQVGLVLQEPFLFSRSVKENLTLGNSQANEREVQEATEIASLHDTIKKFEKGYDTPVGEQGITLSGGQKQRLAIARTLLINPAILIFDDSLSAVDSQTEGKILEGLKARRGSATTLVIAHRLSTVVQADLILVLDQGKLIQKGTHQELLRKPGLYRELWNIQCSARLG